MPPTTLYSIDAVDAVAPTTHRANKNASVHPSGVVSSSRLSHVATRWGFGKLALGGIIAGVVASYYAVLETTCAETDPYEGAGELVITQGGSAKGTQAGTRFPAPLFVNASAKLTANGTADAELLWIENLCDDLFDCSSCPLELNSRYNSSVLRGKILLYDAVACEEIYMCGFNRLGRTLGHTGLVGVGFASLAPGRFTTPGYFPKAYRLGEHRDAKPRGDEGIPFPHFHMEQHAFLQYLLESGIREGAETRAVLTPTAPNPWREMACGYWKPLSTLLMLGHVGVVERATSSWIGHVRTSGLRLDLAQLALVTESVAHLCMMLLHHDPCLSFHWAAFPFGTATSFICGSLVLTCSSTLLLAAFWYVVIHHVAPLTRGCSCDD